MMNSRDSLLNTDDEGVDSVRVGNRLPLPPPAVLLILRVDLTSRDLTQNPTKILVSAERENFRVVTEKPCYIGEDYDTELKSTAETDKEKTYELPDCAQRYHCA